MKKEITNTVAWIVTGVAVVAGIVITKNINSLFAFIAPFILSFFSTER